jgi:hypothetical protein
MQREQLVALIVQLAQDLAPPGVAAETSFDENTRLFGREGLFDSMGLVSVVMAVEQEVNEATGAAITIADDRAMSQGRNPFATPGRLADYTLTLLREKGVQ